MYAVFATPGKQVKARAGEVLRVDYMEAAKEGEKVTFDRVLLVSDGDKVRVGAPYVGAKVLATVVGHVRDKKVLVYKKKKRIDYHKKHGHRQWYTTLRVDSIEG